MAETVTYRGTRPELREALHALPAVLAGTHPDPTGLARAVQLRVGVACLSQVQQDFLTKSRGGTGRDGIAWPPLDRRTVAYGRRATRGELKALGVSGKRSRGFLTPAQDRRWRQVYGSRLARLRLELPEAAARARAAQIAWAVVKREGARTKLDVLGGRTVDIGRDTGRMLRSLSPGVDDRPSGDPGQVFETPPGRVIVGSNVEYFPRFHRRRPVWPSDGTIPPAWWPAIRAAALRGIGELAAAAAKGG
jgi:hypothetical protein